METEVKKRSTKETTIEVTPHAREYLHGASGWAKFLSILMFIMIALMVLGAIFAGSIFSSAAHSAAASGPMGPEQYKMLGTTMTVSYLILAVIYLFPAIYLYRFAVDTRKALELSDSDIMREAFRYQKKFYKFIGILYIIMLSFVVIGIITALIAGRAGCNWMM